MNIWNLFFGKKENVKPALSTDPLPPPIPSTNIDKYNHLDLTSSEPIKIEEAKVITTPPPLPKQEEFPVKVVPIVVEKPKKIYPFNSSYSFESMSKLVKYWYDNIDKWSQDNDYLEYGKVKKRLESLKSHISYKNSEHFELTLFPENCDNWFKISADGYSKLRCSLEYSSFGSRIRGDKEERLELERNRLDTNAKIYSFFYELTTNMQFTASDSFKLEQYCKKHKLPKRVNNLRHYKINGGEYYIYTVQHKHDERFSRLHDIRNPYYYHTSIYKFSDWSVVEETYESFLDHFGENPVIEECQDPKKEFWQHFTKLEIEQKIAFMNKCKEFVAKVYEDEKEYTKLMKEADMENPFPKIVCYSTMLTFCENINKDIPYKEHDINTAIAKLKEDEESKKNAFITEIVESILVTKENFSG